jgi:hypothetical protein
LRNEVSVNSERVDTESALVDQQENRASFWHPEQDRTRLAVGIRQFQLRHVTPDQSAEIAFKLYPGQTFSARVVSVIPMNSTGQVEVSGMLSDLEEMLTSIATTFIAICMDSRPV